MPKTFLTWKNTINFNRYITTIETGIVRSGYSSYLTTKYKEIKKSDFFLKMRLHIEHYFDFFAQKSSVFLPQKFPKS